MNNLTNSLYSETPMKRVHARRLASGHAHVQRLQLVHRFAPLALHVGADFPLGVGALSAGLSGHGLVSTRDRNESPDAFISVIWRRSVPEAGPINKEPWL